MKKICLLLMVCLALCMTLTACNSAESAVQSNSATQESTAAAETLPQQNQEISTEPAAQQQEPASVAETPASPGTEEASAELKELVIEWWELYNPNGFDTLTAVISNPNDICVDVSYDVVFYKDGVEVARQEYFTNYSILPGGRQIVWANYDIPKSTDVDDVKFENMVVSEAYSEGIDGKYEYVGTIDEEACFDFEFDRKPELATIIFLLYSDKNGNGKFDKGEIVVTSDDFLMEQKGRVSFTTEGYEYTDYEVFFSAY